MISVQLLSSLLGFFLLLHDEYMHANSTMLVINVAASIVANNATVAVSSILLSFELSCLSVMVEQLEVTTGVV